MSLHAKKREALRAEIKLYQALYKYRALSTEQVREIVGYGRKYVYDKLAKLNKEGYIITSTIKGGYKLGQRRQGNYHRIATRGIKILEEHGYPVVVSASDLRVRIERLPYLLVGHDLSISLEKQNWLYKDSREVKRIENINRGDLLYGTLTTPNKQKEYLVYVLLQSVQPEILRYIQSEIERNSLENVLIITRGKQSFSSTISNFTDPSDPLIKGGSVKVLPFQFAKSYLPVSVDCSQLHKELMGELGIEVLGAQSDKNVFESNVNFDYLVKYNGEEMYFMDLLDNDLMKLRTIREYRVDRYRRDGRKVLVLTSHSAFHKNLHEKELESIPHVTYLPVSASGVIELANSIADKNVFE